MPRQQTTREIADNINLIDSNIRKSKSLEKFHCENCNRDLWHPNRGIPITCPYCYRAGHVERMKKQFSGLTLIQSGSDKTIVQVGG
ncbi:hypothetical protein LCGC14_1730040 [marine sediment metagenome]|uniref:Uncharacterized protein n=1 Tax=marine sediment metagenome TaxID=412755 RepID=A0A0F9K9K8_9ZZZZ